MTREEDGRCRLVESGFTVRKRERLGGSEDASRRWEWEVPPDSMDFDGRRTDCPLYTLSLIRLLHRSHVRSMRLKIQSLRYLDKRRGDERS